MQVVISVVCSSAHQHWKRWLQIATAVSHPTSNSLGSSMSALFLSTIVAHSTNHKSQATLPQHWRWEDTTQMAEDGGEGEGVGPRYSVTVLHALSTLLNNQTMNVLGVGRHALTTAIYG